MFINLKKSFYIFIIFFLSLLFLEGVFRLTALNLGFTANFLRVVAFTFVYAFMLTGVFKLFGRSIMVIALPITVGAASIYYLSQNVYYLVVEGFYSINLAEDAGQGVSFLTRVAVNFTFLHILYFIPFFIVLYFSVKHRRIKHTDNDFFDGHFRSYRAPVYMAIASAVLMIVIVGALPEAEVDDDVPEYSHRQVYDELLSPHLTINRFGLLTFTHRDIAHALREPIGLTDEDQRAQEFLDERPDHEGNSMTGLFEDKNLIYITAESLDTFSLHPELMPNYFDMLEDSYHFENFYAPLYYRYTADTEFMKHTSFYPNQNVPLSMEQYGDNHFPNTLPSMFSDEDYTTQAYHNYSDFYYPRSEFFPDTLGFDSYTDAEGMNLWDESQEGDHPWPSDLKMMQNTMDDYIDQDQFFSYYLSVSGHLPYDESHDLAVENLDIIESIMEDNDMDTDIDEELLYFHAAHYEFDLALGYLIETLKDENIYDDTVIVIASDHFAYGLDSPTIEEYDDKKNLEETTLNMHNVPMMIHHPGIDGENTIENTISTIDMMPTLANMFGLDIKYNQILGYDVFERHGGAVSFQDLSFLKDDYFLEVDRDLNIGIRNDYYTEEDVLADFNRFTTRREISRYILETDFLKRFED